MNKVILTLSLIAVASGLNLEAELKAQLPFCAPVIPANNVNIFWIRNTEIWYFPYLTRNELILTSKISLNESEFTRMSLDTAASKICTLFNWDNGDVYSFGKKLIGSSKLYFNPIRPGVAEWELNGQHGSTIHFVLTDNLSYVVGVDVFPDGSRGAFVMTSDPDTTKFTDQQVSEWKQKFLEIGFEEGNFIHTPTNCAQEFWESSKLKQSNNPTSTAQSTMFDLPSTPSNIK